MITKDEVHAKVDNAYADIIKAATQWKPTMENAVKQAPSYPAKVFKFTGTYADVNKLYQSRKWSLSLPIVPPTVDRVNAMLKGTKLDPAKELWVVPPRNGILTVELVATLGVMAGAQPEHMPLLLAVIEAMKQPELGWQGVSTTTAATAPMVVISGPIIEKLKLNDGTGTAAGENPVTNALGYFINLVGDVVGGSVPPTLDKSTQGTSFDLVANVLCENVKRTPWKESFAEAQGFSREDSVVTMMASYGVNYNVDHDSVASKDLANTFANGIAGAASGIGSCFTIHERDPKNPYDRSLSQWDNTATFVLAVVGPEHADTLIRDFKTKEAIQDYLVHEVTLPYKRYPHGACKVPESFGKYDDNTLLPRFTQRSSIKLVVAGGPGKQSQFWVPFPQNWKPVSVKVVE
ncbi:MAG: thiol-disulfide oxidoreductase [Mailhella sp.]|nr:thiol-disulfide oxidoreductase [Mailhella sp.]